MYCNGDVQQLAGIYQKPPEGKAKMGKSLAGLRERGGRRTDIWAVLHRYCAGDTDFQLGDVGGDPPPW